MRRLSCLLILWIERNFKGAVFSCSMCGQCILRDTAFTCPMRCPKGLRNGPCGGYTASGGCEIGGCKKCVWVTIYKRAKLLNRMELLNNPQPPLNWELAGTSSWLNYLSGRDGHRYERPKPAEGIKQACVSIPAR